MTKTSTLDRGRQWRSFVFCSAAMLDDAVIVEMRAATSAAMTAWLGIGR